MEIETRIITLEEAQFTAASERQELRQLLVEQSAELNRLIAILDTITRVRNFIAWLSPVFTIIGIVIGMKL